MLSISSGVMPGKTKKADEKRLLSISVRRVRNATVYKSETYSFVYRTNCNGSMSEHNSYH